jgi:hypothetical protein
MLRTVRGRFGKIGASAALGMGMIDGGLTFYDRRTQHPEESMLTSLAYSAANVALWELFPGAMMAWEAYNLAKAAGEAGFFNQNLMQARKAQFYQRGASWTYQDTQTAATMRQRGLQAMMESRMAARSALGGEARALHRGAL